MIRLCSAVLPALALAFTLAVVSVAAQKPGASQPPPPDVAKPPADATKTPSGLAHKILQKGKGDRHPGARDVVTVHYTGWTTDGKMFDSSLTTGKPLVIELDRLIKGWGEGVPLMVAGEKRRFWIPEALAYMGKRDPKGMLVFDIELLDFKTSPFAAPADVAAPPADSRKTPSGLAYKVLEPGKGGARPGPTSQVTVNYTGWTTDGKMFDSSKGNPITFGLNEVIAGWTEGVQLMTVGERMRFWIPERLAYEGKPGAPRGMLVFDVELVAVK